MSEYQYYELVAVDRQRDYDQKLAELKRRYAKKTSHWQGLRRG